MKPNAPSILILEDDPLIRLNLEESLKLMGFEVTTSAANSEQALKGFQRRKPDLALIDIHLENSPLDGIELGHRLRESSDLPMVFLTALINPEIRNRILALGPAAYLIKPCSDAQLEVAIALALQGTPHPVPPKLTEVFFVKDRSLYRRLHIDQVYWIEAANSSVVIESELGRFVVSTNLKGFARQYNHPHLIKIHRSYLVNMSKVIAFDEGAVQVATHSGKVDLPIGTSYRQEVLLSFHKIRSL
jgi:DNA-binding LytR/AlgR family response regulator